MVVKNLEIMRNLFLLIATLVNVVCIGQISNNKTDSIEIYDKLTGIKKLPAVTKFDYLTNRVFNLDCSDRRVYSFLIPNTQFWDNSVISFEDTGYLFTMGDTVTVNISDTVKTNNLGSLHQSLSSPDQVIIVADSTGIKFIKKDRTYIKFY